MSFTQRFYPVSKHRFFNFYVTGTTSISESLNPAVPFHLAEVRLHLSTVHVSVVDLNAMVSGASVSVYNTILFSQAMNAIRDLVWQPSTPMFFREGDTINFSMYMSAANVYGLMVNGWTVTG